MQRQLVRQDWISIHALREEGDYSQLSSSRPSYHFYPRPPRGGRRRCHPHPAGESSISIHALREEGDPPRLYPRPPRCIFLSTPSARRATPSGMLWPLPRIFLSTPSARRATSFMQAALSHIKISIHALRVEGDSYAGFLVPGQIDFYPRPPRGGRRGIIIGQQGEVIFLSTPSARRATIQAGCQSFPDGYFYPRPPRGGRRTATPENIRQE